MNQGEVRRKQIQFYSYAFGACVLLLFGRMIGNNGIAYLAVGLETIGLFMIFLGDHIADVLSKMIRYRRKRNQFHDVLFLKKRVWIIQIIAGILCFVAIFLLADIVAKDLFGMERAALIIRILAPVLLLRMVGTILTGHLQSFGIHMPVALVSLLRQIFFLIFGNIFCKNRLAYGEKVAALLKSDDFYGMYGAVGLAIAITLTEVIMLILLIVFYFLSDRRYDNKRVLEGLQKSESVSDTILNFTHFNIPSVLIAFCKRALVLMPFLLLAGSESKGIFYGKYLVIYSIPVCFVAARFCLLYSRLVSAIKSQNSRTVRDNIQTGIQYSWAVGIWVAVMGAVLAPQIGNAFFAKEALLITFLQYGSVVVLAVIMLSYFCMVQMAYRKPVVCILSLLGTGILFIITEILLGKNMQNTSEAVIYAGIISLLVGALLLGIYTIYQRRVQVEYIAVFVIPLICVGVTGVIVLMFAKLLTPHIGNAFCLLLAGILGVVLYVAALGLCRAFSEIEIERLYGKQARKWLSIIFR